MKKINKKILMIVFLFFIPVSFLQGEDPCITDPTDTNCFEDFETIFAPGGEIENVEEPDVLDESSAEDIEEGSIVEKKGKSFFSSWIFLTLMGLLVLIGVVILYLYLKNRKDNSEYSSNNRQGV